MRKNAAMMNDQYLLHWTELPDDYLILRSQGLRSPGYLFEEPEVTEMRKLNFRQLVDHILHGGDHSISSFAGIDGLNGPYAQHLQDLYRERIARNEQDDREIQRREEREATAIEYRERREAEAIVRRERRESPEGRAEIEQQRKDREKARDWFRVETPRLRGELLEEGETSIGQLLNLQPRQLNVLKRAHIRSIEHLDLMTTDELLSIRNLGQASLTVIKNATNIWFGRFPQYDGSQPEFPPEIFMPEPEPAPEPRPPWASFAPPVLESPSIKPPTKIHLIARELPGNEKLLRAIFGERAWVYLEWEGVYTEIEGHSLNEYIHFLLDRSLSDREGHVLKLRFGLNEGSQPLTYEQTCRHFGVTRERIRQIEAKSLRKLRHPTRTKYLRPFLYQVTDEDEEACEQRHSIFMKLSTHYKNDSQVPELIAHQLQRKVLVQVEGLIDETDWKEINRIAHYSCTVLEELPRVCGLCEEPTLPPFEWCIIHIKTGGKLFPLICDGCGVQFTRFVTYQTSFTRRTGRTQHKVFHDKACMHTNIGELLRTVPRQRRSKAIECSYCDAVAGEDCKTKQSKGHTAGRYLKKLHPVRVGTVKKMTKFQELADKVLPGGCWGKAKYQMKFHYFFGEPGRNGNQRTACGSVVYTPNEVALTRPEAPCSVCVKVMALAEDRVR